MPKIELKKFKRTIVTHLLSSSHRSRLPHELGHSGHHACPATKSRIHIRCTDPGMDLIPDLQRLRAPDGSRSDLRRIGFAWHTRFHLLAGYPCLLSPFCRWCMTRLRSWYPIAVNSSSDTPLARRIHCCRYTDQYVTVPSLWHVVFCISTPFSVLLSVRLTPYISSTYYAKNQAEKVQ